MRVSVLVVDQVFDSGLAAVLDVLRTADALRGELAAPPPAWKVRCVTPGGGAPVRTAAGHLVDAVPAAEAGPAELLVVPGLWRPRAEGLTAWVASAAAEPAVEAVLAARAQGARLAAACAGTFVLAEAGVLDGLQATTSWWLAPAFRKRYPRVELDETRMVVPTPRVTTAGAALAHLDLALALVRATSPALAELTSRYLILDSRPSQAGYAIPGHLARTDPLVDAFERRLRARLDEPLGIADVARELGVSERTLQRAVRAALGVTPIRLAQQIRLEQAVHLLRTTDLPLATVARRVGYENATTLATLLRRRLGTTPGLLRDRP
ncbi:GlxA family transcriptional regulator [Streptacidiphilus neutrinimicus]|uniref:GlxA family transcriptional regulator n=1 Tax=Streptacidiphilus neutrinimicus TaxID=105420 RepID=UPI0005A726B1|nr:helix-turn-helix domain-containing protein [Streptacidiphilus neutrinimicus]